MAIKVSVTGTPLLSSRCVFTVYWPMKITCTSAHGVTSAVLIVNLPYSGLFFSFIFSQIAHLLTSLTHSATNLGQSLDFCTVFARRVPPRWLR